MAKYSKLIAALLGAGFAIAAFFGIGDGESVFGITKEMILGIVTPILTAILVERAPANKTS